MALVTGARRPASAGPTCELLAEAGMRVVADRAPPRAPGGPAAAPRLPRRPHRRLPARRLRHHQGVWQPQQQCILPPHNLHMYLTGRWRIFTFSWQMAAYSSSAAGPHRQERFRLSPLSGDASALWSWPECVDRHLRAEHGVQRLQEAEVVALPRIIVKRWPGAQALTCW